MDEEYGAMATWCSYIHHPDKMCRHCWDVFDFAECLLEGWEDKNDSSPGNES